MTTLKVPEITSASLENAKLALVSVAAPKVAQLSIRASGLVNVVLIF